MLFSDAFNAGSCDYSIAALKREMGVGVNYEFHFKETSDRVREKFLCRIAHESFSYYGFVLNKPRLYASKFANKQGFYDLAVGLICENARPFLKDAKVILDQCGDRAFKQRLEKSLKDRLNGPDSCLIKQVKMETSHTNNLLQLADMVCGAVARSYSSGNSNRDVFRNLIRKKEACVQFWPK